MGVSPADIEVARDKVKRRKARGRVGAAFTVLILFLGGFLITVTDQTFGPFVFVAVTALVVVSLGISLTVAIYGLWPAGDPLIPTCPECGLTLWGGEENCDRCGRRLIPA